MVVLARARHGFIVSSGPLHGSSFLMSQGLERWQNANLFGEGFHMFDICFCFRTSTISTPLIMTLVALHFEHLAQETSVTAPAIDVVELRLRT
jgi:hypothetical protein